MTLHPHRYPKHRDPDKGQVYGETCNVTKCDRTNAVFWNIATHGLYCSLCAKQINWREPKPICVQVDEKPDLEAMDLMYKEFFQ